MKIFTKMAAVVLACVLAVPGEARVNVVYQRQDSLRIVGLLQQARAMKKKPASWMLWFGKQMAGVPYVGGTLDRTKEEVLIVNTRELDCTKIGRASCRERV